MAGRSSMTAKPPFSFFKRSTKLRLRTRSQVISGAWDSVDAMFDLQTAVLQLRRVGTRPGEIHLQRPHQSAVWRYRALFFGVRGADASGLAVHTRLRQVQ